MQRNSAAFQQQQQMAIASALAAGIHPSMWTAQYNMLLSGQKSSHDGYSEAEFTIRGNPIYGGDQKEPNKIGGSNLAQKRLSDSCNSYQGRDSPVDAAGLYPTGCGIPIENGMVGSHITSKTIPAPSSNNAAAEP